MSLEPVQKIDRKALEALSKDELIDLFINMFDRMSEEIRVLKERVVALENENLILKGEKKSPTLRLKR